MKIHGFFLDKGRRAYFINQYLYCKASISGKAKPRSGIVSWKLKNFHQGVPGYWLQIILEENKTGKDLKDILLEIFEGEKVPQQVFYPKEPTEADELIQQWHLKYNFTAENDSPDKWKVFYKEVKDHFQNQRIREAYLGLNLILKHHPEFLKKYKRYGLYEEIAIYYEEQGKIKKAEWAMKKPLHLSLPTEEPYLNLSAFYMIHGMEEKAHKIGKFALKRYPANVFVICNHAVILSTMERYDQALALLTKAEKNGVTDPLLYKTKGEILSDLEQDKEAVQVFKKGLKKTLSEDKTIRIELLSNLAECYIHTEEYKKAVKTYEKIYIEDPKDLYHLTRLVGTNFYDLKDYDQALKYGELLIKSEPGVSSYHYLLGLIRMERNDLELAQWHLYKAKQLMPAHPLIEEELRELKTRKKAQRRLTDKLSRRELLKNDQ